MKYKVSELDGAQLDAAVAKADGIEFWLCRAPDADGGQMWIELERQSTAAIVFIGVDGKTPMERYAWSPSLLWEHGGPILERERIEFRGTPTGGFFGVQHGPVTRPGRNRCYCSGPTLLIAAMRCYVASIFGEEVDLP